MTKGMTETQLQISLCCEEIKKLLLEKNLKYGDAAVNPIRIFSNSPNLEQIEVRIDDKLSRIKNQPDNEDEDVILDLIGYLVLYRVAKKIGKANREVLNDETQVPKVVLDFN